MNKKKGKVSTTRVTKKQIKEDKLVSTTAKLSILITEHWKEIIAVSAGIVVVVGAIVGYYKYTAMLNERAGSILDEAVGLYAEAESAMEKDGKTKSTIEKYEKARAKFQEVIQRGGAKSIVGEALFYSGRCAYEIGRYNEAISDFENAIKKRPKDLIAIPARDGIAKCYEQLGDNNSLREAIQRYEELSRYPESYITVRSLLDRGRCHEKLGEFDQALAVYRTIVDRFRSKVELAIQAKSKALVQKAVEVIKKYESALGEDRSDANFNTLLEKAKVYVSDEQGQWFEALKIYDQAIFYRNEHWYKQRASGELIKPLQEAENALSHYENESMDFIKNVNMGRKYERQGDWSNAIRFYGRAVQFSFLPSIDLYEEALFRINWIDSVLGASHPQKREALEDKHSKSPQKVS